MRRNQHSTPVPKMFDIQSIRRQRHLQGALAKGDAWRCECGEINGNLIETCTACRRKRAARTGANL